MSEIDQYFILLSKFSCLIKMGDYFLCKQACFVISQDPYLKSTPIGEKILKEHEISLKYLKTSNRILFNGIMNILMYLVPESNIYFFPTGLKCSEEMLHKFWNQKFQSVFITNIEEVFITYSKQLYDNIVYQFPDVFNDFNFGRKEAHLQKKIYGYFVQSNKPVKYDIGREISHVFTNYNTLRLMTYGIPRLSESLIQKIRTALNLPSKLQKSCIIGQVALALYGLVPEMSKIMYEIWTIDKNVEKGSNIVQLPKLHKHLTMYKNGTVPTRIILGKNRKIIWDKQQVFIPRHVFIVEHDGFNPKILGSDPIYDERLIAYYKGVKFLCMIPKEKIVLANKDDNIKFVYIHKSNPYMAHNMITLPETSTIDTSITYQNPILKINHLHIYQNCLIGEIALKYLQKATSNMGVWILNKDSTFDIIISKKFDLSWITTFSFLTAGTLAWYENKLYITYKTGDYKGTKSYIASNMAFTPTLSYGCQKFHKIVTRSRSKLLSSVSKKLYNRNKINDVDIKGKNLINKERNAS